MTVEIQTIQKVAFLPHSSPYKIHSSITTPYLEWDIKTVFQCLHPQPNEEHCIIQYCFPLEFPVVKIALVPMTPNTPCYSSPQHHPPLPINSAAFTVPMLQKKAQSTSNTPAIYLLPFQTN